MIKEIFSTALIRIKTNYVAYLISFSIPLIILFITYKVGRMLGIDLGDLTRDPNTILKGHTYTGMISNAGIFFWSASATICFFTAVFLYRMKAPRKQFMLMLFAGLLSFILGFDDVFQMHEKMFSNIRYVPEELFFLAYAFCIVFIVIICFETFLETDFVLWSLALFMFMMSLVVDKEIIKVDADHAFWEDGFKFTGIILWATYYLRTAMMFILQHVRPNGK
ncbi:MAG: hypothetical protein IPK10_14325 [Bacteroidetes bacterium]|nr:hypothetical protein [Bacteroidota bacterium]